MRVFDFPDPSLISSSSKPPPSHSEPLPHKQSSTAANSSSILADSASDSSKKPIPPVCVSLPSIHHPGRKSVLSLKVPPVSKGLQQRKAIPSYESKPLAGLKRSSPGREESSDSFVFTSPKRHSKKTWLDEVENAEPAASTEEKKERFFWEKTFMESGEEGKEQDPNCKTQ